MYGMINDAIKTMVTEVMGATAWEKIQKKVLAPADFERMGTYDDALTYNLVGAVSEMSGQKPEAILEAFGRFWIQYASKTAYGPIIRMFGENFKECVTNLDQMHLKMGAMMPGMRAPQFSVIETNGSEFTVRYRSTRAGLSPMVKGLIEGLGIYFEQNVKVGPAKMSSATNLPEGMVEESTFLVQVLD